MIYSHFERRSYWPLVIALAASLFVSACAAPNGELNVFGGVTSSPEDATHRVVFAKGNGSTEMITLRNMVVRRAAEDTIKAGYKAFEITSISNETRQAEYQTGASSSSGCGKKGCSSTYTPAGTTQVVTPTMEAHIAMSNNMHPSRKDASFFIAADVLREYQPQSSR